MSSFHCVLSILMGFIFLPWLIHRERLSLTPSKKGDTSSSPHSRPGCCPDIFLLHLVVTFLISELTDKVVPSCECVTIFTALMNCLFVKWWDSLAPKALNDYRRDTVLGKHPQAQDNATKAMVYLKHLSRQGGQNASRGVHILWLAPSKLPLSIIYSVITKFIYFTHNCQFHPSRNAPAVMQFSSERRDSSRALFSPVLLQFSLSCRRKSLNIIWTEI